MATAEDPTGRCFSIISRGARKSTSKTPTSAHHYQVVNFLRFCELCVELGTVEKITLVTAYESELEKQDVVAKLTTIENSVSEHGIELKFEFRNTLHDRAIRSDNGWTIQLGRGLDIYQSPEDWLEIGANDLDLRPLKETTITYVRSGKKLIYRGRRRVVVTACATSTPLR